MTDFDRVFAVLEQAQVRYLVVGGVAVVLHGHTRFTADLDLVLHLEPGNVRAAVDALATLGYRPSAPVSGHQLADPQTRRQWVEQKGLTVLSFWSPELPATEVDLFVEEPFPFESAYARGISADLGTSTVRVVGLEDLVALKRKAGRPKDLEDIRALEALMQEDDDE